MEFRVWISYLDVNFYYPNAVTRLTVDRASVNGTPTCVFQINNPQGFLVGPPNIDLNKSRSFSWWLCSTHACWGALALRKVTHERVLWFVFSVALELQFWSGLLLRCRNVDCLCLYSYICCGYFMFAKSKFSFICTCYCPLLLCSTCLLSQHLVLYKSRFFQIHKNSFTLTVLQYCMKSFKR